jgi:DNA-binding transcriptional ArsR family regulator
MAQLRSEVRRHAELRSLSLLLNAAGNETRMRILYVLWRDCEVRVNDIAEILDLTTPAISQQLKKLRAQRLVETRRDAQTIYYRLNADVDLVSYIVGIFQKEALAHAA